MCGNCDCWRCRNNTRTTGFDLFGRITLIMLALAGVVSIASYAITDTAPKVRQAYDTVQKMRSQKTK